MKNLFFIIIIFVQMACAFDNYYYQNNQKIYLTPVTTPSSNLLKNNSDIDYHQNEKGIILGVGDKIIVKIKDGVEIDYLLSHFNLSFEKMLAKNLYLLKTENKQMTIDISNRLNEHNEVEYAQPDFIKMRHKR
ncbi:MAG TPA: hypothetical protein CFH84_10365 [Sulfurimonas sp. UBA12504]|nr:MAG: hypothetical protein A2019_05960 [Sulfurimonas sp. GWF2_37_8]DAB29294.1 MAG TPA: hypothetical protein CFH84_10365 [Sulfurimonas sp. UBA12504]